MRVRSVMSIRTSQMLDARPPPIGQQFRDEAPMATGGAGFATQQDCLLFERVAVEYSRNVPLAHQRQKGALVRLPGAAALPIVVEQLLRRRQPDVVLVLGVADGLEKIRQIAGLGEPRELRVVVEPDVEETPDTGAFQALEEVLGRTLCKTDCGDLHGASPPNSPAWVGIASSGR